MYALDKVDYQETQLAPLLARLTEGLEAMEGAFDALAELRGENDSRVMALANLGAREARDLQELREALQRITGCL